MKKKTTAAISAALVMAVPLVGCSKSDSESSSTTMKETTSTMMDDSMSTTTMAGSEASANIVETAVDAGDFTTLVKAVQAAGLVDTLSGKGPFTVFAPTDEAFSKLPSGTLDTLLKDPTGQLKDILNYHVIAGDVMASDVAKMDGQEVETVNGAKLKINVSSDGKVSLTDAKGNSVNVIKTDVKASNGVIHVIDGVLMP